MIMTNEEKELLLKDLSARLPYGIKVTDGLHIIELKVRIDTAPATLAQFINSNNLKYYLRPMSSMTEEEREHLQTLHDIISDENYGDGFSPAAWEAILDFNNYCREHHLDNGGLITLGLALAPKGMYNTKQ